MGKQYLSRLRYSHFNDATLDGAVSALRAAFPSAFVARHAAALVGAVAVNGTSVSRAFPTSKYVAKHASKMNTVIEAFLMGVTL